jgi:CTP-dependent riboflavin kinase
MHALKKQVTLQGIIARGFGHFTQRMTNYPDVFRRATGVDLFTGTLNVDVGREITIKEDFRIKGTEIGEPLQDLLFERCAINGIAGYRIRPFVLATGEGGHGDHVLEICSTQQIPDAAPGNIVQVTLFRDDIDSN